LRHSLLETRGFLCKPSSSICRALQPIFLSRGISDLSLCSSLATKDRLVGHSQEMLRLIRRPPLLPLGQLQTSINKHIWHIIKPRTFVTARQNVDFRPEHTEHFGDPLGRIRQSLHFHKQQKWGYFFYRCDYTSDDLWYKFVATARAAADESLQRSQGIDIVRRTFEMTLMQDKATLHGATINQVRDILTAWIRSDEAKAETSDSDQWPGFRHPQYTYCVHVDADVLDAVINHAP